MRVEPFTVLFWALGFVLTHICTVTGDPARRPGIPQPWHWHCTVWQGSVRFNLLEDASAPSLYPSRCIICLCFPVSLNTVCLKLFFPLHSIFEQINIIFLAIFFLPLSFPLRCLSEKKCGK